MLPKTLSCFMRKFCDYELYFTEFLKQRLSTPIWLVKLI